MEVIPGAGDIFTKQAFGDCQLHVEWRTPVKIRSPRDAGNSGIMIMGLYELQVFDSWTTTLYSDGGAGAMYGQHPPQVNASLQPGEWQSFDILWHRPHFTDDGQVEKAATVTALHNGVLIQDNVSVWGAACHMTRATYDRSHENKLPLSLQEHHNAVRYRNIWVRELPKGPQVAPPPLPREISVAPATLDEYVGQYGKEGFFPTVERDGLGLRIRFGSSPWLDVIAVRDNHFVGTDVDAEFTFVRNDDGLVKGVYWQFSDIRPYFEKMK